MCEEVHFKKLTLAIPLIDYENVSHTVLDVKVLWPWLWELHWHF